MIDTSIGTPAQARVQMLLDELIANNRETGLQVAAYLDGELVVDAWAGIADPASGAPVESDTMFVAFSASKGVTSTVIHQLVEAGKLDYDAPVAEYWPEFAAHGKGAITVRHTLCHQAGIPQAPRHVTPTMMVDWDAMVQGVEQLKPLWKPGERTGYHGITFGVILGELARRVAGRPFAQIVQDSICAPLGIEDMFFGVPAALETRVATIHGQGVPWWFLPSFLLIQRTAPRNVAPGPKWNNPAFLHASIPAGNMVGTARSLARHYAALVGDGVDGVRLLSPETVARAATLATDAPDQVFFGGRIRKGLGYWVGGPNSQLGLSTTVFGHTGAGGSVAFADLEHRFSFALLKNRMTWRGEHDTDHVLATAVREALGLPVEQHDLAA